MPIQYTPESAFAQEMVKWEAQYSPWGAPKKPFVYQEYPMMMYKAGLVRPSGIVDLHNLPDPVGIAEREVADDETMRRNLESRGFVAGGPKAAVDAWKKDQAELAAIAAARNYEDRNRGEKAQAEIAAAEAASFGHIGEVPRTPVKRRGRAPGSKNKPKAVADGQ